MIRVLVVAALCSSFAATAHAQGAAGTGGSGDPGAASKRRSFYAEVLTFLALNPLGVTTDQLITAFGGSPSDIRKQGGVARMSDPGLIRAIKEAVTIPVMAKARIGHFVEAQLLQALKIDYIDESEVLTPADEECHIDKSAFVVPFVCGARNLGEATRRIAEGAAMIRTKGEAGTGNVVEAVRHQRTVQAEIRRAASMSDDELYAYARDLKVRRFD